MNERQKTQYSTSTIQEAIKHVEVHYEDPDASHYEGPLSSYHARVRKEYQERQFIREKNFTK